MTVILEYLDLYHTKCAKLPFLGAHFSNFPPIFPAFCSLLLPTYFSKNFASKIGASLQRSSLKVAIYLFHRLFIMLKLKIIPNRTALELSSSYLHTGAPLYSHRINTELLQVIYYITWSASHNQLHT